MTGSLLHCRKRGAVKPRQRDRGHHGSRGKPPPRRNSLCSWLLPLPMHGTHDLLHDQSWRRAVSRREASDGGDVATRDTAYDAVSGIPLTPPTPDMTDDPDPDPEEVYRRVLGTIEHNTGDPQPPMASVRTVMTIVASYGDRDPDAVRNALSAAVDNDDLVAIERDGEVRFALATEEALLDVIEAEIASDDTSRDLIGICNNHLDRLRRDPVPA